MKSLEGRDGHVKLVVEVLEYREDPTAAEGVDGDNDGVWAPGHLTAHG